LIVKMDFEVVMPCGGSLSISLDAKQLQQAHNLLQQVYTLVSISPETRKYFGVSYADKSDGGKNWLKPEDNLKTLNCFSTRKLMRLQFEVRLYPKDPDLTFPTSDARKIFRQHMKNLLTNNEIGCENQTSAMLDAFIVQAELGDYIDSDKSYFDKVNNIKIYAPNSLCSGTPLTETQYLKIMRMYHRKLKGMSPEQADILFLSLVQKIPMYGYSWYQIADEEHDRHFLALSREGLHFIYESCMEKFIVPQNTTVIRWQELVYCEIVRKKIKIGHVLPRNTNGVIIEKFFKIKSKYSHKGAQRFKQDFNAHKGMFFGEGNSIDGGDVLGSRKEASQCYSAQLPRRANTLGARMESIRSSIKHKGRRVGSGKEKRPILTSVTSTGSP